MNFQTGGTQLRNLLGLRVDPVAVAFRTEPPPDVPHVGTPAPAGCAYWRLAAEGQVFFTRPTDHHNCPIGAHTHGVALPADAARELGGLLEMMARIQYIRMDEVPTIPRLGTTFGVAIYAPLTATPVEPDVIIVQGNAKQVMLLAEALYAAGLHYDPAARLRPTCAIVPTATEAGRASLSLGCIGNRVYTGLADSELYVAIPGAQLNAVLEKLETVVAANRTLEEFHHQRELHHQRKAQGASSR
ncbi:MAG: DUF169 domain-containing protein [candidate division NC10 bacterium]|nr:DUF169 domain-containing protein [candidate division NC10 bacterium]